MSGDDVRSWLLHFGIREATGFGRALEPSPQFVSRGWSPRIDLFDHEDLVLLRVELPGVDKDEVAIVAVPEQRAVVVRGVRQAPPSVPGRSAAVRLEIDYGPFERTIELPEAEFDYAEARAELADGMLSILVPKVRDEESQRVTLRHKIQVRFRG
jgi:HSP20 family protein